MSEQEYTGTEWRELMKQLGARELRKVMRSAYRKTANKAAKEVRDAMRRSGLKVKGDRRSLDKSVRVHIYTRGGGFLVTTKPHGKKGFHVNRFGKEKPVAMWAAEGTADRYSRKSRFSAMAWRRRGFRFGGGQLRRGRMRSYHFVDDVTERVYQIVEGDLFKELEAATVKQAAKAGFV